jgi:hypothetical protein
MACEKMRNCGTVIVKTWHHLHIRWLGLRAKPYDSCKMSHHNRRLTPERLADDQAHEDIAGICATPRLLACVAVLRSAQHASLCSTAPPLAAAVPKYEHCRQRSVPCRAEAHMDWLRSGRAATTLVLAQALRALHARPSWWSRLLSSSLTTSSLSLPAQCAVAVSKIRVSSAAPALTALLLSFSATDRDTLVEELQCLTEHPPSMCPESGLLRQLVQLIKLRLQRCPSLGRLQADHVSDTEPDGTG